LDLFSFVPQSVEKKPLKHRFGLVVLVLSGALS